MSKKSDLQTAYRTAGETIKAYHEERKKIQERWDIPEDQKVQGLKELKTAAEYNLNQCRKLAIAVIDSVRSDVDKEYEKESIDKLFDPGYQASVNIIIDGLKKDAFSRNDFKAIVKRFEKDQFTLNRFRDVMSVKNSLRLELPSDRRAVTLKNMDSLQRDIERYMDNESFRSDYRTLKIKRNIAEEHLFDEYTDDMKLK